MYCYQFIIIKIDCIVQYNYQCLNSKIITLQKLPFFICVASQSAAWLVESQKQLRKRSNG